MKTRKYIYTTLATCLFVFSSCLNDLDVLPLDPTVETADKAYTDAESYTKGLHKIYSVWALSGQDGSSSVNTQFRAYPFYKASEWMPHKKLLLNSIDF